jgi:uncharacterized protein YfiM (DUF2279 family)
MSGTPPLFYMTVGTGMTYTKKKKAQDPKKTMIKLRISFSEHLLV